MFGPICCETCAIREVEHWTTAPDIKALAVATAVLDKIIRGGPDISVIS